MKPAVVLFGDVYNALSTLPDGSVNVAITSPPYWKQRDYGFEGQIGQENTPEEYIGRLVKVFSLLREKLADNGVFFLNVGDKYMGRYGKSHLLQIPYRLAYHMVKDGWILKDILVWYKPNHMPSSVKDRFANTYEPVFVFVKSPENAYRPKGKVLKVPLQPTPWKHTAVFPEKLVLELLGRTSLKPGYTLLDPFAGTGTLGYVALKTLRMPNLKVVMVEKGREFVEIIARRVGDVEVVRIEEREWDWNAVEEEDVPEGEVLIINNDRFGEMFIAKDTDEFLRALRGTFTEEFRSFHREDALYIFGVKDTDIRPLYYMHAVLKHGYTLRNTVVVEDGDGWYPLFVFARASTRVAYRFFLDRLRRSSEVAVKITKKPLNMVVRDAISKRRREGRVVAIDEEYGDGFPKKVKVLWEGGEREDGLVLHPLNDTLIRESVRFLCPRCKAELSIPYDPLGSNVCPTCGYTLWKDVQSTPLIEEPKSLEPKGKVTYTDRRVENSKYLHLERNNWGASPAARRTVLGEYFTRIRLYDIPQGVVAQYLNLLRRAKGLKLAEVVAAFPPEYEHTVGHWFRKDFGGSIPRPEDIPQLINLLGDPGGLLHLLMKTALKLQTVKSHSKGKNPGDFWRAEEIHRLKYLY